MVPQTKPKPSASSTPSLILSVYVSPSEPHLHPHPRSIQPPLAEIRNAAFSPPHDLRDSEYFEIVIFMNDVLPCVDDLLELIWQSRRSNAGITCARLYVHSTTMKFPLPCFTITGLRWTSTGQRWKMRRLKRFPIIPRRRRGSNVIFLFKSNRAGTESRYWIRNRFTRLLRSGYVWLGSRRASAVRASVV